MWSKMLIYDYISFLSVFRRPYCDDFLNFCALNFELGIWSSRKRYDFFSSFSISDFLFCFTWYLLGHSDLSRENVASVVNIVMREFKPRLLFCWVGQLTNACSRSKFFFAPNIFMALICSGHI